jgi:hypothetical protein
MTLYEKIIAFYPFLNESDFDPIKGTILLQNDGNGDYVKTWTNSNPRPTQDQLNAVTER